MKDIDILVYKYNDDLHYQWKTKLLREEKDYILVYGEVGRQLVHHTKNKIFDCATKSLEFFSLKEGYTVNIDIDDLGNSEYYCNICLPSKFNSDKNTISFIDLDLDLLIDNQGTIKIVDEDEFATHSISMNYSSETIDYAKDSLSKLKNKIIHNEFPFDGFLESHIDQL